MLLDESGIIVLSNDFNSESQIYIQFFISDATKHIRTLVLVYLPNSPSSVCFRCLIEPAVRSTIQHTTSPPYTIYSIHNTLLLLVPRWSSRGRWHDVFGGAQDGPASSAQCEAHGTTGMVDRAYVVAGAAEMPTTCSSPGLRGGNGTCAFPLFFLGGNGSIIVGCSLGLLAGIVPITAAYIL